MAEIHENVGHVQSLHCNCGSVWTFKDGGLEFKAGKFTPKEWRGLTDEEIWETPTLSEFARAIEAKLRSKNT